MPRHFRCATARWAAFTAARHRQRQPQRFRGDPAKLSPGKISSLRRARTRPDRGQGVADGIPQCSKKRAEFGAQHPQSPNPLRLRAPIIDAGRRRCRTGGRHCGATESVDVAEPIWPTGKPHPPMRVLRRQIGSRWPLGGRDRAAARRWEGARSNLAGTRPRRAAF